MKKVFALFLAVLILITNVGVTFATHYCGGKAVKTKVSMLGHADVGCGMEDKDSSCDNNQMPTVKSNCCQDKILELKNEDDFNSPKIVKSTVDYKFVAAFVISYINLYSFNTSKEAEYLNYSPPLLNLDIPVLVQSFLL